jgi:hypothetical protein
VLGGHLALELEALIDRSARIDLLDGPDVRAELVSPDDALSARLPAWA